MTAQETHNLIENIIASLEAGSDMASAIAPQLIPFIVIGKALDKMVPDLASTVQKWIEGNPPTPEEREEFKAKLAVLDDPNLP